MYNLFTCYFYGIICKGFKIKSRVSGALLSKNKRHLNSQLPVHVYVIPTSLSPHPFLPGSFLAHHDVALPLDPKL
jgi:hypothetical protein